MSDYKPNENRISDDELDNLLKSIVGTDSRPSSSASTYGAHISNTAVPTSTHPTAVPAHAVHAAYTAGSIPPAMTGDGALQPARFQPTAEEAKDSRALLLTPDEVSAETAVDPTTETVEESELMLPDPPATRNNPFKALWRGFCSNFPRRGDSAGTKARKFGFLTAMLVMLCALAYLAVDLLVIPARNTKLKNDLIQIYHPEQSQVILPSTGNNYPKKMLASFKDLYDRNSEVRGWISFHADAKKDFLDIEYPIVYSGDNEKYLDIDFDGNKNRNGTLFFDQNNRLNSYEDTNRALIVYGHNMASGQMFAGLNKFLGSVNNARSAPTLTMSTLFRENEYVVFAVMMTDESDGMEGRYFNTRRTSFSNDADFMEYIEGIRMRSLFDYPVEVEADDELLVLSTCTSKSTSKLKNGRMVVVARRLRDGEKLAKDHAESIVKNDDVIMPYYWYINQDMKPHQYYADLSANQSTNSTTTTNNSTTRPGMLTGTNGLPVGSTTIDSDFMGESTTGTGDTESTTGSDTAGGTNTTTSSTYPYWTGTLPTTSNTQPSQNPTGTTGSTTTKQTNPNLPSTNGVTVPTSTQPTAKPSNRCSHVWDNDCDTDCNLGCGFVRIGHAFDNECDTDCNLGCGYVRETSHVYTNDCDPTCDRCGASRSITHVLEIVEEKAFTCTEDGYIKRACSVCGFTTTETTKAQHVIDHERTEILEDACIKDGRQKVYCKNCDYTDIEVVPKTGKHVYDDENDTDCNVCGKKRDQE